MVCLAGRSSMSRSERFGKHQRLSRQRDFDRVLKQGCAVSDQTLVVIAAANQLDWSRLGVMVSRRVGSAVVRNRWKRRIREAFRRQQHRLPVGFDLVVRPRRDGSGDYQQIARSLARLAWQAARRSRRRLESASTNDGSHLQHPQTPAPCEAPLNDRPNTAQEKDST